MCICLPGLCFLISTTKSAGECVFSPEESLILGFPLGRTRKHTQGVIKQVVRESKRILVMNPGCAEAKVTRVSPPCAILQYVNRVWMDSVQMDWTDTYTNHPSVIYTYSEKWLSTTKTLPCPSSLSFHSSVSHHRPLPPSLSMENVHQQTAHRWLLAVEEHWRDHAYMHDHSHGSSLGSWLHRKP